MDGGGIPDLDRPAADEGVALVNGPLTGIWLSEYEYRYKRDGRYVGPRRDRVTVRHFRDGGVRVRSVRSSLTVLSMDLTVRGREVSGTLCEMYRPGGWYEGALFHGLARLAPDPDWCHLSGTWIGWTGDTQMFSDTAWSLTFVSSHVTSRDLEQCTCRPGGALRLAQTLITGQA